MDIKKPELVVGAGDMEKLKIAAKFGADAIYCGASDFSLRAKCKNFSREELALAVTYLHNLGKKIYITVNSIIHEDRLDDLRDYLIFLNEIKVDAVIFSDMAVLSTAQELNITPRLHLSTQASTANSTALQFYRQNGVSRVNLARECSLAEIKRFKKVDGLSLEAFIHGAMCMSYSGRCLLSNFLAARGANDGSCAQACRWKYYLTEEKRPDQKFEIIEEESGRATYIFNSRDLMALELIPELYAAGIDAFKIEGRIKGPHYIALVTLAYRKAIDYFVKCLENNEKFEPAPEIYQMLNSVSNRGYITGFYLGRITGDDHNYETSAYIKTYRLVGIVSKRTANNEYHVFVKNNITAGQKYQFVSPQGIFEAEIEMMKNMYGDIKPKAGNTMEVIMNIKSDVNIQLSEYDLIRERNSN